MHKRWYLDPEFIMGFLIFIVLRPLILLVALVCFSMGIVDMFKD
jgi:hypothetical protein